MRHDEIAVPALDYRYVNYRGSRLRFRGPRKRRTGRYAAFVGATETFGRFVPHPFVERVEEKTGITCLNLGCVNAGIGAVMQDPSAMAICVEARLTVIEVMGAHNLSNRFYTVHPRRNDRFLRASGDLRELFPELDFADFVFTRHMLRTLRLTCPERFARVRRELTGAWIGRTRAFLETLSDRAVLFWFADRDPPPPGHGVEDGRCPLFVDREMIAKAAGRTPVIRCQPARDTLSAATGGLVFAPEDADAARLMLGIGAHEAAADALAPLLREVWAAVPEPAAT